MIVFTDPFMGMEHVEALQKWQPTLRPEDVRPDTAGDAALR
jgi:hypothetical protein